GARNAVCVACIRSFEVARLYPGHVDVDRWPQRIQIDAPEPHAVQRFRAFRMAREPLSRSAVKADCCRGSSWKVPREWLGSGSSLISPRLLWVQSRPF